MKRVVLGSGVGVAGLATFLCIVAARYQPTVRPGVLAGPIAVGGLTPEEAAKKLRLWWEFEKQQKFELVAKGITGTLPQLTPSELGATLDDVATVANLPLETITSSAEATLTQRAYEATHVPMVFKVKELPYTGLTERVKELVGNPHPARVEYVDGQIVRSPEVPPVELDVREMPKAVITAMQTSGSVELPLKVAEKHISDDALAAISDEVSEFSTHFPASNHPRCSNIKVAAGRLNGHILMPGERLSFNEIVGRRTLRTGFKLAGIYKNGKHDTGIGGGICQVSTTLYNASLLGNLKIHRRSNHSLPVAYVPLGRDATVDYGNLDLVVENNYPTPIAVISEFEPGRLTFRLLGKKDPDLEVKITTKPGRTDRRTSEIEYVQDPALPKGLQKVVDPGTVFRSVMTYRQVYRGGKLVETQSLGPSYYGGAVKVIAVGTGKPPAAVITPALQRAPQPVPPSPLGG